MRIDVNGPVLLHTIVDAADIKPRVRDSARRNRADGNHVEKAGRPRIADQDIVAAEGDGGACSGAQRGVVIAGAVLKRTKTNSGV